MPATSKTAKDETALVSENDLLNDYLVTQTPAMGSEVEQIVTTAHSRLISVAEHDRLKDRLAEKGVAVSDEPLASIFELKTKAHTRAAGIIREMKNLSERFSDIVRAEGYNAVQLGYLGHVILPEAMAARIPSERADGLLEHFIAQGQEICARQPLMTSSVHLSISYADIDHAYQMGKLLMVLTPSLTALCENTGGTFDGKPCPFNPSATIRLSQTDNRGGLSPVIVAAESPVDLARRQARHVFNTRMMMHLDENGAMRVIDAQKTQPSLSDLQARNLNTRSNALLSESMQYHMLKMTSLRDSFGRMSGKRLEIRMADNGPFQHDFMALVGEAIGFSPVFRARLGERLMQAGLDPFALETGQAAETALSGVAENRQGAMAVRFDATTVGHVTAILLSLLEDHYRQPPPALTEARYTMLRGPAPVPAVYGFEKA